MFKLDIILNGHCEQNCKRIFKQGGKLKGDAKGDVKIIFKLNHGIVKFKSIIGRKEGN
jgi:hypothetical protein